ncbi:MAG: TolC family protein [Planctomycetota bacterium]
MKRPWFVLFLTLGCASPPETAKPEELPFASAYLVREASPVPAEPAVEPPAVPALPYPASETGGLLEVAPQRLTALRGIADDGSALGALLRTPIPRTDLEGLAYLRSPAVRAARERLEAARTHYQQSADLKDLVALYRSFLRETQTRVGPERSRRATASIAPYPNIDALSGELIEKSVAIALEELRRTIRDTVADAERAHADAVRLVAAQGIVRKDVRLHRSLVKVLRARIEAGTATQAALLAFQARLEALQVELEILGEQQAAIRARWNRLLHRPESARVQLADLPAQPAAASPSADRVHALALEEQQSLRIATLSAERQAIAVRLAETMTLPRLDLGTSRFERERAGEAGVQRGAVFPAPGRMNPPRWEFGIREAQVAEMRARKDAADHELAATRDRIQTEARTALFSLDAAQRRWRVHSAELVPLAERSFETTRGSYEGNRAGYIELLDADRRLLEARLGRIDARRVYSHARARLLQVVGVRLAPEGTKK